MGNFSFMIIGLLHTASQEFIKSNSHSANLDHRMMKKIHSDSLSEYKDDDGNDNDDYNDMLRMKTIVCSNHDDNNNTSY